MVPVSVCGPRDPPLWDLETPIPASASLVPLLPWGCSCSFWNLGLDLQSCRSHHVFHIPSQGEVPAQWGMLCLMSGSRQGSTDRRLQF